MISKKMRIRLACVLVFCLTAALVGPRLSDTYIEAKAVSSYVDTDSESGIFRYLKVIDHANVASSGKESDSAARHVASTADDEKYITALGQTMSTQMLSFVNNMEAASGYITEVTGTELSMLNADLKNAGYDGDYKDIVSKVKFTIPAGTLPSSVRSMSDALFYLEQVISRYPALCCLFTMATLDNINNTLTVYSPVPKSQMGDTINEYRTTLNDMLVVPKSNTNMNDADKLLYIHDQVVALTEYSVGRSGTYAADYIPAAAMLYNLSVCQSYAAVYNQAARELGLLSHVIYSRNHAWVAVRIGGYWYYVDPTWDDTRNYGEGADTVRHDYVFVGSNTPSSNFDTSHTPYAEYATHFSDVTSALGSSYDDYYPKKNRITSQMGYANGGFYYAKDNNIYQWVRSENKNLPITGFPTASSRRTAVLDGYLYVSGSTGIYKVNPSNYTMTQIDNASFTGMYEAAKKLYVSKGGAYYIYLNQSSPVVSPAPSASPGTIVSPLPSGYTPLPSASGSPAPTSTSKIPTVPPLPTATIYDPTIVTPSPGTTASPSATDYPDDDSFTKPGKTTITTLKNNATRAAYIKWKKVSGATRYQVQYSPSKSFNTKQIRISMTSSVTIANLFKKKTYYFRVRAVKIKRVNGVIAYKYASWSSKKKLKIKK